MDPGLRPRDIGSLRFLRHFLGACICAAVGIGSSLIENNLECPLFFNNQALNLCTPIGQKH